MAFAEGMSRVRVAGVVGTLLAGTLVFARAVDGHYAIADWLLVRYAAYVALSAWLALACLAVGCRCIAFLDGRVLRFYERVLLAFACGVLIFGLGVFVAGVLGWYGPIFFLAWPTLLVLAGLRHIRDVVQRTLRVARWPRRSITLGVKALEHGRAAFLGLGLLAVYLQVLTPGNVSFDARWYHLAIAERYAGQGSIQPFREGWYLGAYPQLASWLYTWAFQMPGDLFDHVALCSHIEWTLFLATVPGVGLLARRVAKGSGTRWSGAALFLFPSLLIYDSNLNTGADHVLAFWAIPLALSVASARRALSVRSAMLFGTVASGALLTKYQAVYLIAPACAVALALVVRTRRWVLVIPALTAIVVLTTPHWLKNCVFYGDPLYPLLHRWAPTTPFHAGAADAMRDVYFPARFMLQGSTLERLRETLPALLTFSFQPHNWPRHGIPQPTFGSLFTLFSLTLPFLTRVRALWLLCACTYSGVFIWFWTNHQDRFLQALLPWMAVCIVAIVSRIWTLGRAARAATCLVVLLQIAWGADAFFYPNHRMLDGAPIKQLADFIGRSPRERDQERFSFWGNAPKLGALLPPAAVVLGHDAFVFLGIGRPVITDQNGFQGTFGYRNLPTARDVWKAWRALGVTHVAWASSRNLHIDADTLAREAAFYEAVWRATDSLRRAHGYSFATLSEQPPPDAPRVLRIEGCGRDPESGKLTGSPTVVAVRESCSPKSKRPWSRTGFKKMASFGGLDLWVRTDAAPASYSSTLSSARIQVSSNSRNAASGRALPSGGMR
jgi:hypothetical protein